MKAKVLDQKRADYNATAWRDYHVLYEGGHLIQANREHFLPRRPVETDSWYALRLGLFTYKNTAGTLVDELAGTVLQQPLSMDLPKKEGSSERDTPDAFYTDELDRDPTGSGEGSFNDLAYEALGAAMVKQEAWAFIGFPEDIPGFTPLDRGQQEEAGLLRATVTLVEPEAVLNAHWDQLGLAWVMLKHRLPSGGPLDDAEKPKEKIVWTHYARKTVQKYEIEVEKGKDPKPDDVIPAAGEAVEHKLAKARNGRGAVPLVPLRLKRSLWIMDRLGLVAKNELTKRNGLNWYEELSAYPQPYHAGEDALVSEDDPTKNAKRGAQYFLEIEKEAELGYLEPTGAILSHLSDRLDQLKSDMHEAVRNMAAAQGPSAAKQVQSAASKARDAVAQKVLAKAYSKKLREWAVTVWDLVAAAREEKYAWEAGGADRFDTIDQETAATTALTVGGLPDLRNSPTFVKEHSKRTAHALLPDLDTATRDKIDDELEAMDVKPPDDGEDPEKKEDE